MERDIKDIVGILMRVLGGGEVLPAELNDLDFEAEGELEAAHNEALHQAAGIRLRPRPEAERPCSRSRDAR
jgi:hypothetical protein